MISDEIKNAFQDAKDLIGVNVTIRSASSPTIDDYGDENIQYTETTRTIIIIPADSDTIEAMKGLVKPGSWQGYTDSEISAGDEILFDGKTFKVYLVRPYVIKNEKVVWEFFCEQVG